MPKDERHIPSESGQKIVPKGVTARERRRASHRRRKNMTRMVVVGVFVLIVGIIALLIFPPGGAASDETFVVPPAREHPLAEDNTLGAADAAVVLEEFADFQCSACASFWQQIEPILIEQYISTGQVKYIYRSANDFLGADSANAAEGAYCAGEQGKFWEMHDMLYANFAGHAGAGGYSDERLTAMAGQAGLDADAFSQCLKSDDQRERVQQDGEDFRAVNQDLIDSGQSFGTPTLAINGVRVDMASSWEELFAALDAAIAASAP
ncbi:MAG: thioredoxin domain-containing protein [Chloroflexi bacterium]|nr:thioredoxin domain-containing protein [Chloroflexota bacterium]